MKGRGGLSKGRWVSKKRRWVFWAAIGGVDVAVDVGLGNLST